jgi:hypothetical protein
MTWRQMQSVSDRGLKLCSSQRLLKYTYAHISMKMSYCWADNLHISNKSTFYWADFIKTQSVGSWCLFHKKAVLKRISDLWSQWRWWCAAASKPVFISQSDLMILEILSVFFVVFRNCQRQLILIWADTSMYIQTIYWEYAFMASYISNSNMFSLQ